jgi:hypothetical protein
MDDTQKLESIRNANKERQKRFYEKNKTLILHKKKVERDLVKVINTPKPEIIIPKEFSLAQIIDVFTANINTENTRKKYINDIKRVFLLAKLQTFVGSMEEFNSIKKAVSESKYSLSTQRGSIQSILVFIDLSKIVIDPKVKARYALLLDVAKAKTDDQQIERINNPENTVIPYDEYLKLILDKFGVYSKQYLLAKLYDECCVRDNFSKLMIVTGISITDDKKDNYLLCEGGDYTIILNDYKTKSKYETQTYKLSTELNSLISVYILQNKLTGFLFPQKSKSLSSYIIAMNKQVGVNGGINTIRKMKVTTFLNREDIDAEDRLIQSRKMCHSENTQKKYKRIIKKNVVEPKLLEELLDGN